MSAEDHSGSTRHNRIDTLTSKEQGWVGQQQKAFPQTSYSHTDRTECACYSVGGSPLTDPHTGMTLS